MEITGDSHKHGVQFCALSLKKNTPTLQVYYRWILTTLNHELLSLLLRSYKVLSLQLILGNKVIFLSPPDSHQWLKEHRRSVVYSRFLQECKMAVITGLNWTVGRFSMLYDPQNVFNCNRELSGRSCEFCWPISA